MSLSAIKEELPKVFNYFFPPKESMKDAGKVMIAVISSSELIKDTQDKLISQTKQERIKKADKSFIQELDMLQKQVKHESDPNKRKELEEKLGMLEQDLLKRKMSREQVPITTSFDPRVLKETEQEQEALKKKIGNEKDPRRRQELQLHLQEGQRRIQEQELLKKHIESEADPRKRQRLEERLRIHEEESKKKKYEQEQRAIQEREELRRQLGREMAPQEKKDLESEKQGKHGQEKEDLKKRTDDEKDHGKQQALEKQSMKQEKDFEKRKVHSEKDTPVKTDTTKKSPEKGETDELDKMQEGRSKKRKTEEDKLQKNRDTVEKVSGSNEKVRVKSHDPKTPVTKELQNIGKIELGKDETVLADKMLDSAQKPRGAEVKEASKKETLTEKAIEKPKEPKQPFTQEYSNPAAVKGKKQEEKGTGKKGLDKDEAVIANKMQANLEKKQHENLKSQKDEDGKMQKVKKTIEKEAGNKEKSTDKTVVQPKDQKQPFVKEESKPAALRDTRQGKVDTERKGFDEDEAILANKMKANLDREKQEISKKERPEEEITQKVREAAEKVAGKKEKLREKQEIKQDEIIKPVAKDDAKSAVKDKKQEEKDTVKKRLGNDETTVANITQANIDREQQGNLKKQKAEEEKIQKTREAVEKEELKKEKLTEKEAVKPEDPKKHITKDEAKPAVVRYTNQEEKDTGKKEYGKDESVVANKIKNSLDREQQENLKKQIAEEDKMQRAREAAEKVAENKEKTIDKSGIRQDETKKPKEDIYKTAAVTDTRQEEKGTGKKGPGRDEAVLANKMFSRMDKEQHENSKKHKIEEDVLRKSKDAANITAHAKEQRDKSMGDEIPRKDLKPVVPSKKELEIKPVKGTEIKTKKLSETGKDEIALANKMISQMDKEKQENYKKEKAEEEILQKARDAANKIGAAKEQHGKLISREFSKKDFKTVGPSKKEPEIMQKVKETEVDMKSIQVKKPSGDDLIFKLIQTKRRDESPKLKPPPPTVSLTEIIKKKHKKKEKSSLDNLSDRELDRASLNRKNDKFKEPEKEIIHGTEIYTMKTLPSKPKRIEDKPKLFKSTFNLMGLPIVAEHEQSEEVPFPKDENKGILRYALSDRTFIEKGWTLLPMEKIVRKMNVYRMKPAHPEFDWFTQNKNKKQMLYDSGEKLAEFEDDGRCRWYYRNGRIALEYYNTEDLNDQQRFVIYSSGELDDRGRSQPITVLGMFDYLGNGVVFDHGGKIRLKYNQTEGVVLDRELGPVSNWKWHSLNDPPVLQQVMIDTHLPLKDPVIMKLGNDKKTRPDNEEMLAIELNNFINEKSKKTSQKFQPFQIRMKALKINENFSLRVIDQASVYLLFRDGSTHLRLNMGMVLDQKEIVDTEIAEVGEVLTSMDRQDEKGIEELQALVRHAQAVEKTRVEQQRRLRPRLPAASVDRLVAAVSCPMHSPFIPILSDNATSTAVTRCYSIRRKPSSNLYYDTRLI